MKPRRRESGFAMLLVFLLAACVAIMLYAEMPRVAFEAERQKELLLVDRGNQFKRAIQVFVTDKTNNPAHRYPASIDELQSFNNHRYLRRKYVDPLTGKDEWRLVHMQGGVLTDSVTTQNPNQNQSKSTSTGSDYIMVQRSFDAAPAQGGQGATTMAMRRRPSETPGAPGSLGGSEVGGAQGMQGDAGGGRGIVAGVPVGLPGGAGQAGGAGVAGAPGTGQPAQTCTAYIGGCTPVTPTGGVPVGLPGMPPGRGLLPGQPGNPVSSQAGGVSPYPTTPGSQGASPGMVAQPGMGMNPEAQSAAAAMIGDILTRPRPGGMPTSNPGGTIGGGIAGVASKFEAEGIMVINDRTAINEWEYIFDMQKYHVPPNPVTGTVGNQPTSPTVPLTKK